MEKNIVQMASKEKITRMESKIKLLEGEVEKLTDYCQKQEKQIKTIISICKFSLESKNLIGKIFCKM